MKAREPRSSTTARRMTSHPRGGRVKALHLDPAATHAGLGSIVTGLHVQKQVHAYAESLFQTQGHFSRDSRLAIGDIGQGGAADPGDRLCELAGWYMWQYKYTGKAATFTVRLPAYSLAQSITLKSNGFVTVNFTVP